MPSRAEWRRGVEGALRLLLVALLAIALLRSVRATRPGARVETARASTLGEVLSRTTTSERIGAVDVSVDETLSPVQRAWLAALRNAGVRVRWHGDPLMIAVSAGRAREPEARARVRLVADSGGPALISDSVGEIDSVRVAAGASLETSDVVGLVTARQGAFSASAPMPGRVERRDVLVLGKAAWESRFVLAALGEAGWKVRARLPVAPGVAVVNASLLPIDTSRYDVVIALDSTAGDLSGAIARFVGQGGGVIAAGSALNIGALRAIVPARAGARQPGRILLEGDTITRADLPVRPLVGTRGDVVALERQPAGLTVAIRRAGRGRVAAVGYDETWRWRMQGGTAGEAAHREWWSRMTGLVAPERASLDRSASASANAAPRAALVAALGPASSAPNVTRGSPSNRLPLALLVTVVIALLAETASRRFRGAS